VRSARSLVKLSARQSKLVNELAPFSLECWRAWLITLPRWFDLSPVRGQGERVSRGQMQFSPGVPAFDKVKQTISSSRPCDAKRRRSSIASRVAKSSRHRIVVVGRRPIPSTAAHRLSLQRLPNAKRRILAALVAVMDDAVRPALAYRPFPAHPHQLGAP